MFSGHILKSLGLETFAYFNCPDIPFPPKSRGIITSEGSFPRKDYVSNFFFINCQKQIILFSRSLDC